MLPGTNRCRLAFGEQIMPDGLKVLGIFQELHFALRVDWMAAVNRQHAPYSQAK
jgi:hypothetical protein